MVFKGVISGQAIEPVDIQQLNTNRVVFFSGASASYIGNEKIRVVGGTVSFQEDMDHVAISQTDVVIAPSDGNNPKFGVVQVNLAGTVSAVSGAAAANPVIPSLTNESSAIVAVKVGAQGFSLNDDGSTFARWDNTPDFRDGSTEYTTVTGGAVMHRPANVNVTGAFLRIEADLRKDTAVASQEAKVHVNTTSGATGDGYAIKIDGTGAEIVRVDSGTDSAAIVAGGTISADTSHNIIGERDDDFTWRLFVDGVSVGTPAADSTYISGSSIVLHNIGTNQGRWDNIQVKTASGSSVLAYEFSDYRNGPANETTVSLQKIVDTTLTSKTQNVDIDGLNINEDGMYLLELSIHQADTGAGQSYSLTVNNDNTAGNYNVQQVEADSTTLGGARVNTGVLNRDPLAQAASLNMIIYLWRDGFEGIPRAIASIGSEDGSAVVAMSAAWNKTAAVNNITSIRIAGSASSAFNIESRIRVYKVG